MKNPTSFEVAPDGGSYIVVIVKRIESIAVKTRLEAEQISDHYRSLGLEVTIYQEWDLQEVPQPQLLLPLEATVVPTEICH